MRCTKNGAALAVLVGAAAPVASGTPAAAQSHCPVQEVVSPVGGDDFGTSLDLDGERALVGARYSDALPASSGAVYVLERAAGAWSVAATLDPATAVTLYGSLVRLDGDLALATQAPTYGLPFAFERTGSGWSVVEDFQFLGVPPSDGLGSSIDLDGNRALIGAGQADDAFVNAGAVFVVERQNGVWQLAATLTASDAKNGDGFGGSGALNYVGRGVDACSLDGNRALVGASGAPTIDAGAAYVFELQGTTWVETARLASSSPQAYGYFGHAVELTGTTAYVGAPFESGGGNVYVFELQGTTWTEVAQLSRPGAWSFGEEIDAEGDTVVINAESEAWVFQRQGTAWIETAVLDHASSSSLQSVAASDGRVLIGGVVWGTWEGTVVAHVPTAPATFCTGKVNSLGCVPAIDAAGVAGLTSPAPFPVTAREVLNNRPGLLFYGLSGRAALPFLGGTLCALPPLQRTGVQVSGGNPVGDDCSGAYLFDFNAWAQGGNDPDLVPGQRAVAQFWSRDPVHPDGTGVGLTDAVEFDLCP